MSERELMNNSVEKQPAKSWVTEGIIIAGAPVVAYSLRYSYEVGFVSRFSIPSEFITIDLAKILPLTVVILGGIGIAILLTSLYRIILGFIKNIIFRKMMTLLIWVIVLCPVVFISLIRNEIIASIPALFLFLSMAFIEFVRPLLTQKEKIGYLAKLGAAASMVQFLTGPLYYYLGQRVTKICLVCLGSAYLMGIVSLYGALTSMSQDEFPVVKGSQEMVVLRKYGDQLICVPFDRATKTVEKRFTVLNLGVEPTIEFVTEKIGPLRLEKELNKEK
jgi:hypothetical protein